jgi:hypothetical protein
MRRARIIQWCARLLVSSEGNSCDGATSSISLAVRRQDGRSRWARSNRNACGAIAVLMSFPEDNRTGRQEADALRQGLGDLGWIDGRNIRIDFRWDVGESGRAQSIAKEVVAMRCGPT